MSGIVLTYPIVAGKAEAWRRFCQEMSGSRRQLHEASRRRLGITGERLALVETAFGSVAVATIEAPDVGGVISQLIASARPFDRWYRAQLQELHGINLASYEHFARQEPPLQNQELLFEWTLASSADG